MSSLLIDTIPKYCNRKFYLRDYKSLYGNLSDITLLRRNSAYDASSCESSHLSVVSSSSCKKAVRRSGSVSSFGTCAAARRKQPDEKDESVSPTVIYSFMQADGLTKTVA